MSIALEKTDDILNYLGENGTHTEYVEGLMATDMHKTSDDLARFYKSAV